MLDASVRPAGRSEAREGRALEGGMTLLAQASVLSGRSVEAAAIWVT